MEGKMLKIVLLKGIHIKKQKNENIWGMYTS